MNVTIYQLSKLIQIQNDIKESHNNHFFPLMCFPFIVLISFLYFNYDLNLLYCYRQNHVNSHETFIKQISKKKNKKSKSAMM